MLREALYTEKVAFDVEMLELPRLTRDERLARWEVFLARLRPLAQTLAAEERANEQVRTKLALVGYTGAMVH